MWGLAREDEQTCERVLERVNEIGADLVIVIGGASQDAAADRAATAFKKKMGFYGASRIWYLKRFDAYCTAHEIERFFAAAARLHAHSPWRWQAVAFFTLMHSCGPRAGETRLLPTDRVDLREGRIDVLWSKGNRSCRLPLIGQVIEVLTAWDHASRKQFGPSRQTFFVSATGQHRSQPSTQ